DYPNAIGGVALILLVLFSLVPLQGYIERKRQTRTYRIVFNQSDGDIAHYEKLFGKFKLNAHRVKHSRVGSQITGQWAASGSAKNHDKFTDHMLGENQVQEFDF
ncbi:MAG: MgtC/SapB family protein, partial [Cytophagales bacterium]|nr:MgtC/SapB family protein [Cytophagales bacterium]